MEEEKIMTEKHKKQKRLSIGLQIVSVLLTVVLTVAYSGLVCLKRAIPTLTTDEVWELFGGVAQQKPIAMDTFTALMHGDFLFTLITSLLLFYILHLFQNVCREIGKDNSFSVENVKNFNKMAWTSLAAFALYVIKMIVFVTRFMGAGYARVAEVLAWGYTIALVVFLSFAYLCRSLAKLIFNAYEVQSENDLTI